MMGTGEWVLDWGVGGEVREALGPSITGEHRARLMVTLPRRFEELPGHLSASVLDSRICLRLAAVGAGRGGRWGSGEVMGTA